MFPNISIFQAAIENVKNYFCGYTDYLPLDQTFSDRQTINGFLIKEADGETSFEQFEERTPSRLRARKNYNIWLQFKEDKLDLIVRGLVDYLDCSPDRLISMNTDSSEVFKELTTFNFKGFDKTGTDFRFAKISVSLTATIQGKLCQIC